MAFRVVELAVIGGMQVLRLSRKNIATHLVKPLRDGVIASYHPGPNQRLMFPGPSLFLLIFLETIQATYQQS